jgi:hypothetical protein
MIALTTNSHNPFMLLSICNSPHYFCLLSTPYLTRTKAIILLIITIKIQNKVRRRSPQNMRISSPMLAKDTH